MIQATLCYLIKDKQVLLAMKKRGFGEGKWNGIGGKVDKSESIVGALVREVNEEIAVEIINYQKSAELKFYWEAKPEWNMQVHVYLCDKWQGDPKESEEMKPRWFDIKDIPLDRMWVTDQSWFRRVLIGEKLYGEFVFDQDEQVVDVKVKKIL